MGHINNYKNKPNVRFAIIGDTHITPVEGESRSPWRSNAWANARTRWAVSEFNKLDLDFVIHMGDMIHPVPAQPEFPDAAALFRDIFAPLTVPLYCVPGNHEIGDKPTPWTPASIIDQFSIDKYQSEFGPHYHTFNHGNDVTCVIANSSLWNSGMALEATQWDWLTATLSENKGKKIFFFQHYPFFLSSPTEHEHYDNVAEPARSRLVQLIKDYEVEAVFFGHVHNFFYNRLNTTELYVAPSATTLRLDFSELFSVPPGDDFEHGRNDTGKLGYFLVDVYDDGHTVDYVRSDGKTEATNGTCQDLPLRRHNPLHVKRLPSAPIGVELPHAWADITNVPYSGVV